MKKQASIKSLLKRVSWLMLALAIVPLLISVLIYTRYLFAYEKSVQNISEANQIAKNVEETIMEEAWGLTYGQITPKEYKQSNNVHKIKKKISRIKQNTQNAQERATLNIVLRSLDNVDGYLAKIMVNIENNAPFDENQALMTHVQSATKLVHEILLDFVNVEIESAANNSREVRQAIIVLSVVEVFIIGIVIWFTRNTNQRMTSQIQEPMEELIQMADALSEGKLNYRIKQLPDNELRKLTKSINEMADNLVVLLEENALKQYTLAQSEVRVLQAQITPHFIYNSLDAILVLAELGDVEKVKEMTYALSDFFRISLSQGQDWVPVEKEIKHITDYLVILQIRYGDALTYSIEIEQKIEKFYMLKMILQPIIENAIYHGTKLVRREGKIILQAYLDEEDYLHFFVIDNGKGILPDKLAEINAELKDGLDTDFHEGYGLFNVNKRLLLYYGKKAKIEITSIPEIGTTVHIIIPTTLEGNPEYV
ncbi:histidine kinase [Enterococcus devriesei]|uniref:sensor histidine kinase n=1 Tax=Enterococcus devriesei TaxID=319970 RepID=UPI001C0F61CC|nr:histidine kinase [Enterococcus devriesei]MBU5365829.1 histidine kinase [Enterococcus devriesei]MDT2821980.1 histidine kinase [Enterococcus devriesei]